MEISENKLNDLLDHLNAGVCQTDRDGCFVEANDRFCKITGYPKEELLGMSMLDITHPDDRDRSLQLLRDSPDRFVIEKRYVKKSREVVWVSNSISTLKDPHGRAAYITICTDITKNKEQEERIQHLLAIEKKSRKEIHDLFMQAPAIICILRGPRHVFEIANYMYRKLVGERELIGKPIREALPELHGTGLFEILDTVYRTGATYSASELAVKLERGNGKLEEGYFNFIYQASHDAAGAVDGILVHAVEVTDQILARKQVEESEAKFNTLANSIQNLAWIADGEGWIFWYNKRWYEYTGTTAEQMEGWGWQSVHDPEKLPAVLERWKFSINTGDPFEMVFPLKGADGVFRPFLTRVVPLRDHLGRVVRWIGTNTDISEQKKAEEALEEKVTARTLELKQANELLKQKNNEIEVSNAALQQKNADLELINRELETFTYISSHDLQEPLRKIVTFSDLLEEEQHVLNADAKKYLKVIHDSVKRMQSLLKDLLSYSRIQNREDSFHSTAIHSMVNEVLNDFKESIERSNATVESVASGNVKVIPYQFRQLIQNLLSNALKFTSPERPPRIRIASRFEKGKESGRKGLNPEIIYCHLTIEDNGIGFDPEYSERIFEVFQRLHGYDSYPGTGMGLAICKRIVETHQGDISAGSEPGAGAMFHVWIPAEGPGNAA